MRKLLTLFVSIMVYCGVSNAQHVTPVTVNASGGSYTNPSSYFKYFDWSVGELTLVSTIAPSDSSIVLYQGVLQTLIEKPGLSPFNADFLAEDYKLFPNPTTGKFEVHFFVRSEGRMELELVDILGRVIEKRSFNYNGCCRTEYYDVTNLPAGVYILAATITPDPLVNFDTKQVTRHSGFRIVKLN